MRIATTTLAILLALAGWTALSLAADPVAVQTKIETQVRAIANFNSPADGQDTGGVQLRRARLDVRANRPERGLEGRVRVCADRASGAVILEYCYVDMKLAAGWQVCVGQLKPRFLWEEVVGSSQQIAAERSYTADYFTVDYTQGVESSWHNDAWRISAALHDGAYAAATEFNADGRDVAACARVEWLAAGDGAIFKEFRAPRGAPASIKLGLAADREGGPAATADRVTGDCALAAGALGAFLSATWQGLAARDALPEAEQLGLVLQTAAAVSSRWDIFARWEYLDLDGRYQRAKAAGLESGSGPVANDTLTLWTAGVNWYQDGQASRWTLDVVYAADPVPVKNTGAGLLASDDEGQLAVRLQYQAIF